MAAMYKGWWLAGLALAWLCGVALQLQERDLQDGAVYACAIACGGFGVGWAVLRRRTRTVALIAVLGVALLGFGATGGRAALRLAQTLATALEGRDIVVQGVVASLPQHGASGTRFRLRVDSALQQGQAVTLPALLALGWYRDAHEDAASAQPHQELRAGQRWRLTVRLRRPHGNVNPHGFDYELYLFELGVGATGYVRDAPAVLLDPAAGFAIGARSGCLPQSASCSRWGWRGPGLWSCSLPRLASPSSTRGPCCSLGSGSRSVRSDCCWRRSRRNLRRSRFPAASRAGAPGLPTFCAAGFARK